MFDCDSHIYEPPEIWDKYIPQKQQHFAKTHFYRDADRLFWCAMGRSVSEILTSGNIPGKLGIPDLTKKIIGATQPGTKIGMKRSAEMTAPEIPMRG